MNRLMLVSAAVTAALCLALAGGDAGVANAAQPGNPNAHACKHIPNANRDHGQQRANPSAVNCFIPDLPGF